VSVRYGIVADPRSEATGGSRLKDTSGCAHFLPTSDWLCQSLRMTDDTVARETGVMTGRAARELT